MKHATSIALTLALTTSFAAADTLDEPAPLPTSDAGAGCVWVSAVVHPVGMVHFDNATLQQSAGTLALRHGRDAVRRGVIVATIVGADKDGSLRANHHLLFGDGTMRTRNDTVAAKPGSNKCSLDVKATVNVVDGTGTFAGAAGTLTARGTLDVCGGAGRIALDGKVCRPAK